MADDQVEDLLRAADTAMYHAKAAGRNCYRFYEATMGDMAHNQLSIANNLHDALLKQKLSLVLQPIVKLDGRQTIGYEALARWHDSVLGWISPADFIPVAESTGIIVNLGYWVLREACRSYQAITGVSTTDISLSVNVSAYQFRDKDFIATWRNILAEEGMPPRHLIVEITESQLMDETKMALEVLQQLRDMGCLIAIDDFGTGYSSLSYLRIFPVDILKVDRSFIADLTTDENSIALLKAILMIAASLHIKVVAEGVETQEQLAILNSLGVGTAQGYFLGRPAALAMALADTTNQIAQPTL
jgi:EAL domain-containing protein (putative c-di-GMP-specific phosphodiesterase class I)